MKNSSLKYGCVINLDIRKTPIYGGLFNLSVLAAQLLIMAALINVFAVTFFTAIGAANVDVLGVDYAIESMGLQYETLANNEYSQGIEDLSNDMGHDKKLLITRMAYAVYLQQLSLIHI